MTGAADFPLPCADWAPLAPLWDGARQGRFSLPRCRACGRFNWYPAPICRACGGGEIVWEMLSGRGTLYSWALVDRILHPPLRPLGRYVSAIVAIEEDPATRFVTRVVDADPEILRCDMAVRAVFRDAGYPAVETGFVMPFFTPDRPA